MEQVKESPPLINNASSADIGKIASIIIAGMIIIAGAIFVAYRYSQKQAGNIVLPAGVTYLGPSPTVAIQPTTPPPKFTADSSVTWNIQKGVIYPYSFSFPSTLTLVIFTGDKTDSVAIVWDDIPPQLNILLNMELIESRDSKLINQPKIEYVKNWWKFFSGLKGVASVIPFTNSNGIKGFKAQYLNNANIAPNLDVFFEVPDNPKVMIHMANGILDASIFDRMIDSLKWKAPTAYP